MTRPYSNPIIEQLAQDGERIIAEALAELRAEMARYMEERDDYR